MPTTNPDEYLGLPLPTPEEQLALSQAVFKDPTESSLGIDDFCQGIIFRNSRINKAIHFDKRTFEKKEADEDFTAEDITEYCNGIEAGYEFIIGCFTYTYYLRSRKRLLGTFLDSIESKSPEMPVVTKRDLKRVRDFRKGNGELTPIEATTAERLELIDEGPCFDVAEIDYNDYLDRSRVMSLLIEAVKDVHAEDIAQKYANHDIDVESIVVTYLDGFDHGAAQGVEMYIQSYEEQLIAEIEKIPQQIDTTE